MQNVEGSICLVDDDLGFREALTEQLYSLGFVITSYGSAAEYLSARTDAAVSCLILDLHLPDINGLELQRQLASGEAPQIVFISGRGDIPSSVRAMKAGAVEFLTKPIDEDALLKAIHAALAKFRRQKRHRDIFLSLKQRFDSLTPREKEVFPLIIGGALNKQAAAALGIQEVTIQVHRSQIMRKMEAASFADLVRMGVKLGISPTRLSPTLQSR
ncbi:response regulator transcription factor [Acidicapsa ligni]|uniref:response regulator transcription factor n=1 Tax=Acidicapsa ligni TaxID=542300 RepID=UPI0021E086FA|nr:response regulator [Acidicapsa ligni]